MNSQDCSQKRLSRDALRSTLYQICEICSTILRWNLVGHLKLFLLASFMLHGQTRLLQLSAGVMLQLNPFNLLRIGSKIIYDAKGLPYMI